MWIMRKGRFAHFVAYLLVVSLSCGCSTIGYFPTLGYRPDSAPAADDDVVTRNCPKRPEDLQNACKEYYATEKWGQELSQAYRSRAALNESLIYVAAAIGIVGGTIVTTLAATKQTDSDAYKITPPVAGGLAALAALNQNDEKAEAYTMSAIANDEAGAAVSRYLRDNSDAGHYRTARNVLADAIGQERLNLEKKMIAIRKKKSVLIGAVMASQPTTLSATAPTEITVFITNVDVGLRKDEIRIQLFDSSQSTIIIESGRVSLVPPNALRFTVPTGTTCEDKIMTVSVGNELLLPPKTLKCQR